MMSQIRPKVSLPKSVIISAMLSPRSGGTVDRKYLRAMAGAIHTATKHKNDNMRKVHRETSDD